MTPQRYAGNQRGSGTALVAAVVLVVAAIGGGVAVLAGYVAAAHSARAAADLAALSAAAQYLRGEPACPAAGRMAAANGAQLAACQVSGDRGSFVVSVTVEQQVRLPVPRLSGTVRAEAYAGRVIG